jgi:2-methylisocitrate lyase-like PEP mutase family enzyme
MNAVKKRDLGALLKKGKIVIAPGAWDALSARFIARHGFPAVYLTGYGATASLLARPDIGLVTLSDMCGVVRNICNAIDVPLIADAESGFGNAVNLTRVVREYEQAGAAAIHLEDQVVPKKYGGEHTPPVVPCEDHAAKIRIAVRSRRSDDFLIIGRTDCLERFGLDEAIRRGNAYRKAGADIIFVHGIRTPMELREIGRAIRGPKLVNYSALTLSGHADLPTVSDLEKWGYSIVIYAIEVLFSAARALRSALQIITEGVRTKDGAAFALRSGMMAKSDFEDFLDTGTYRELEDAFLPREIK